MLCISDNLPGSLPCSALRLLTFMIVSVLAGGFGEGGGRDGKDEKAD